jgi:hypothetical protein
MLRRSVFSSLAALFLPAVVGVKPCNTPAASYKLLPGTLMKSIDTEQIIKDTIKSIAFMMPDGTKLIPFDNSVDDSDWYNVSSTG